MRRRRSSWQVARWRIFSNMVAPGTSSTPPTMTRPGSPPAWASTAITSLPGLGQPGSEQDVGRANGLLSGFMPEASVPAARPARRDGPRDPRVVGRLSTRTAGHLSALLHYAGPVRGLEGVSHVLSDETAAPSAAFCTTKSYTDSTIWGPGQGGLAVIPRTLAQNRCLPPEILPVNLDRSGATTGKPWSTACSRSRQSDRSPAHRRPPVQVFADREVLPGALGRADRTRTGGGTRPKVPAEELQRNRTHFRRRCQPDGARVAGRMAHGSGALLRVRVRFRF